MAKKTKRILIRLNSSAGTGYFKTTTINPQNRTGKNMKSGKLRLMKFDPVIRKIVEFVEGKIK